LVPIDDEMWGKASRLGFTLRKAGLTVPFPDLLVAQAALAGGLEVWHTDEHFDLSSRATTLRARAFRE
jgi:predicted nucleic acid-binding protein